MDAGRIIKPFRSLSYSMDGSRSSVTLNSCNGRLVSKTLTFRGRSCRLMTNARTSWTKSQFCILTTSSSPATITHSSSMSSCSSFRMTFKASKCSWSVDLSTTCWIIRFEEQFSISQLSSEGASLLARILSIIVRRNTVITNFLSTGRNRRTSWCRNTLTRAVEPTAVGQKKYSTCFRVFELFFSWSIMYDATWSRLRSCGANNQSSPDLAELQLSKSIFLKIQ